MPRRSDPAAVKKFRRLLKDGVTVNAAGVACGLPRTTAYRLAARAEPFGADAPSSPAKNPDPAWTTDQPPPAPPPEQYEFRRGYHDHTYRSFSAPLSFDGFTLQRIRNAISLHRNGLFLESSALAITLLSFAPILAATLQRLSPLLALPRQIKGGTRGLSRLLREEIEAQLAPRDGLAASPYFPSTLWGTIAFDLAFLGFSVLQHVDGEPDPETGVRPRYTRRWPSWATQYYRYRQTFVALTTEGPVDILNDGKFTMIADSDEPHFLGAIVALGEEGFDGKATQRARASYVNRYGNPKWVAVMPEGVAVRSPEGDALLQAIQTIQGPDGVGVVPFGTEYDIKGLTASQSTTFSDALNSNWQYVAAALLGSDGTMTRGTGVYSAPIFAGVRRDLVDRDLKAAVRGVNLGHVIPYCRGNYQAAIEEARAFVLPALDIPLPDPDADTRIKSYSDRVKALHEIVKAERDAGFEVTQERVEQLAASMSIEPPTLLVSAVATTQLQLAPTDVAKIARVDEARASQGLPPIGDDRGDMLISELDAPEGTVLAIAQIASGEEPTGKEASGGANSSPETGTNEPAASVEKSSAEPPAHG